MGNNPKSALDAWKKRNAINVAPQSGAMNGAGASAPASGASTRQPKTALEAWKERNQPVATSQSMTSAPTAAPVAGTNYTYDQTRTNYNSSVAGANKAADDFTALLAGYGATSEDIFDVLIRKHGGTVGKDGSVMFKDEAALNAYRADVDKVTGGYRAYETAAGSAEAWSKLFGGYDRKSELERLTAQEEADKKEWQRLQALANPRFNPSAQAVQAANDAKAKWQATTREKNVLLGDMESEHGDVEYRRILNLDTGAAQEEMAVLDQQIAAKTDRMNQQTAGLDLEGAGATKREIDELEQRKAAVGRDLTLQERYRKRSLDSKLYAQLVDEPDFEKYAKIGAATAGQTTGALNDLPVNAVHYYRENEHPLYQGMTQTEVDTYDYLLAKEGEDAAQDYLEHMHEELNRRQGVKEAQAIKQIKNPLLHAGAAGWYAFKSGVQGAGQGLVQSFVDKQLVTSKNQFGSQELMKDMSGGGRLLYSAINTIGNMAPSILVSAVTGVPVAGATMMGLSAAGNAYNQALEEGNDAGKARAYSLLVGASEATLQYALGGISKLGGDLVPKALSRVATIDKIYKSTAGAFLMSLGQEVVEEELQLFLEPMLQELILNVPYDTPNFEEIAETAIVTLLSTGMMEGTGPAVGTVLGKGAQAVGDGVQKLRQGKLNPPTSKTVEAILDASIQKAQGGEDVRYLPAPMGEDAALSTQRPAEDDVRPLPKAEDIENAASGTETAERSERDTYTVINKLKENISDLSGMETVAKTSADVVTAVSGNTMAEKARKLFETVKGIVTRPNFGDIEISGRSVKDDLSHGVGPAKAATITAVPAVIRDGKQIYFKENWKGRGYDGYVFAAPVTMDGKTVYVAAVVTRTSKNRFYLHEVVDSEGNIIKIDDGESATPTSLATNGDAGAQTPSPITDTTISHPENSVNSRQDADPADAIPDENVALPLVPTTDPKVQREWNRAAKIAHNFGCRLVVGVPEGGGEGSYLNGVITINPNCKNPVMQVLLHELTHRLENSRLYGKLTLFARNWLDSHGVDVDARVQEIIEEREAQGYSLSERGAMQEVVAEFVQEHLFRNEQAIQRLLREDRTLWQKIRNWLQDAMRWVRKAGGMFDDLYRAERMFEKALRGSDPKMGMSEAQHMIETLPDGRKYVKADRQVIFGNDPEAWGDQIERYINRKIRGGEDVMLVADDGTELWLTADTEGKARFRNYVKDEKTGKERPMTDEEYLAKLSAEAHIDELAQISEPTNGTPVEDEGGRHGELAENGWYYRTAFFRDFDGTYYRVTLSVPSGRNGFTVYNVGRMRERSLPTSSGSSAYAALNGEETSLEHSVRQDGAAVNKENSAERPEYYASMADVPADDVRPLPRAEDLEKTTPRPNAKTEALAEEPDTAEEDPAEQLPTKAREYLKRVERQLVARISGALSVPFGAQREFLRPVVEFITREFLQTGRVSQETLDGLFDSAYDAGVVVDTEYYDNYKFVRDHLRKTALTLSKTDQADITDFGDFRKSIFGLITLKNKGGLPVDVAYMELRSMAPGLFPEDITHPAEQLVRIAEVVKGIEKVEKALDDFYGPDAENFKAWAKRDFEGAVNDMLGELRNVARYAQEQTAKKAEKLTHSPEDVRKAFDEIRAARKAKEKATARNLLTDQDSALVSRLLKGEIALEDIDPAEANVRGIREVFEASQEYERLRRVIGEYNRLRKAKLYEQVDKFLETANSWADKSAGFWYSRETMERNIRDIVPDRSVAQSVIDFFFTPIHKAEAASTRFKNSYRERVKALGLSRKVAEGNEVSEAHAVQFVGEAQDNIRVLQESKGRMKSRDGKTLKDWQAEIDNLWANNPNLDRTKIEGAVKEFRSIYDELFQQMNEVRVRNGYEPVAYRQGYFPHFQSTGEGGMLAAFGKALGFDTSVAALPTTINGLTHTFRPGITWMANAQERQGFATVYDAVEGFDKYINGAADVIHHTDNIQRLRALADRIRYRTGDKGIREQLDALKDRKDLSEQEKDAIRKDIHEKGKYTLSRFVVELEEYTNLLANKKSIHDRNAEHDFGRKIYQVVKNVMGRVAGNMVALNPGSWLTNFIPITQAWGTVSSGEIVQAMWDTLRSYKADDGLVERSAFLTNRRGSDPLVRSWSEQASATLSKPMEWIDAFTSDVVVRAKYLQNLKRGMSEDMALTDADAFAAGVIADRSKGATPTLFRRSNPVTKLLTQFQLEVNNQFSYLAKDIPDELKEKALGTLAAALFKFFLGAFLYNEVYEFFVGRRPALDPIGILNDTVGDLSGWELPNLVELGTGAVTGDMPSFRTERTGVYGAGLAMGTNVAEELPFIGGLLGGGRVPISSALPDPAKLWSAATNVEWSGKKRAETGLKEVAKPLLYTLPPFGGGQLKKTVEGVGAAVQGGSYSVDSKTGKGALQYPVYNDTPGKMAGALVKGTVFGKSSLKTAQEWVEDGFDSYNVRYTDVYRQMNDVGVSDREAHKLLDDIRSAKKSETESADTAKKRVLLESDINEDGKLVTYLGLLAGNDQEEVEKKRDKMAVTVAAGATIDDWLEFEVKVSGKTKRAEKLQVIDGMDLTWKQKDAFYAAAGLSEKTLDEAPWYIERYRLQAP